MISIRLLLAATTVSLVLLVCGDGLGKGTETSLANRMEAKSVIGYLPYWDQARGLQTIKRHEVFTDISLFWYSLDPSGNIGLFKDGRHYEDRSIIKSLRSKGIRIVPTLANLNDRGWDADVVSQIINSRKLLKGHIASIVKLVVSKGYDGIDIDYESLYGRDRNAFSRFIKKLATALHAHNKTLSVTVHAQTGPGGSHARAYDYAALGQAADQVRLMIYNYHWTTSPPGPIAPIHWVKRVASFAAGKIPRKKLILGFGLYGIDWVGRQGREIEWLEVVRLVNRYGARVNWDVKSQSPWFSYIDSSGKEHVVWFENAYSIADKLKVAKKYGVA